jgi:hypothetical protein
MNMKMVASELADIINSHATALAQIPEEQFSYRPAPGKWSKKEILGHLTDSAQNNIRRFVCAQYETMPKIVYNQDQWVSVTNYQEYDSMDLIQLFVSLNKHICQLLRNMTDEAAGRECQTEAVHTIEWLAKDYLRHLLHHLHQVLDLEPVAY